MKPRLSNLRFALLTMIVFACLSIIATGVEELPPLPTDGEVSTNYVPTVKEPFLPKTGPVLKVMWDKSVTPGVTKYRVYQADNLWMSNATLVVETVYTVALIQSDELGFVGVKAVSKDGVESNFN